MASCELVQGQRAASPCLSSNASSRALHLAPVLLELLTECILPSMQILHSTRWRRSSSRWSGFSCARVTCGEVQVVPGQIH